MERGENCQPRLGMVLSCSVTLEKREPFFGKTIFSGAATKKRNKGATCHCKYPETMVSTVGSKWCEMDLVHPQYVATLGGCWVVLSLVGSVSFPPCLGRDSPKLNFGVPVGFPLEPPKKGCSDVQQGKVVGQVVTHS